LPASDEMRAIASLCADRPSDYAPGVAALGATLMEGLMTASTVRVDTIDARRIGFTSDTHVKEAGDFPQQALDAFKGVDLIVHCGHIGNPALLDRLAVVAPVYAVTTALDDRSSGERLARDHAEQVAGYSRVIEAGGVRIGVTFDLSGKGFEMKPEDPPLSLGDRPIADVLTEKFGAPVDVVVSANTHLDRVSVLDGVLLVNPGSPNLHAGRSKGQLGTVAILTVEDGLCDVAIIQL